MKLHLPDVEIVTLRVGERSSIVGRSLAHIELRRRYGVTLLAVRRGSQIFPNPGCDMRLCDDAVLVVPGPPENIFGTDPLHDPDRRAGGSWGSKYGKVDICHEIN
ncbi:MAG: TrkA C-terminal domain-containing protein [Methanosarcinales archaeon]|nr:TrkA C-terminal domain-containing protein [Methanosarcinales archaeon]